MNRFWTKIAYLASVVCFFVSCVADSEHFHWVIVPLFTLYIWLIRNAINRPKDHTGNKEATLNNFYSKPIHNPSPQNPPAPPPHKSLYLDCRVTLTLIRWAWGTCASIRVFSTLLIFIALYRASRTRQCEIQITFNKELRRDLVILKNIAIV